MLGPVDLAWVGTTLAIGFGCKFADYQATITLSLALTLTLTLTLTRRGAVHAAHILLVLVQLCVTIGAFSTTIFLRQCRGALAHGLREKGIDFDGAYSMPQT